MTIHSVYVFDSDNVPKVQPVPVPNELQKTSQALKFKKVNKYGVHQSPQASSPLTSTPPSHSPPSSHPTDYDHIKQRKVLNSIQREGFSVSKSLNPVVPQIKTGVQLGKYGYSSTCETSFIW